jgi:hypothetical protein
MSIEEKIKEWEKEFPRFNGVGAPFPVFKETPNYIHMRNWLSKALSEAREETLREVESLMKRYKNDRYSTDNMTILTKRWEDFKNEKR